MTSVAAEALYLSKRMAKKPAKTEPAAGAESGFANLVERQSEPARPAGSEKNTAAQSTRPVAQKDNSRPAAASESPQAKPEKTDDAATADIAAAQSKTAEAAVAPATVVVTDIVALPGEVEVGEAATEDMNAPDATAAPAPVPATPPETVPPSVTVGQPVPPADAAEDQTEAQHDDSVAIPAPVAAAAQQASQPEQPVDSTEAHPAAQKALADAAARAAAPSTDDGDDAADAEDSTESAEPAADEQPAVRAAADKERPVEARNETRHAAVAKAPPQAEQPAQPRSTTQEPLADTLKVFDIGAAGKAGAESLLSVTGHATPHGAAPAQVSPQAAPVSAAQPVPLNALAVEIAAQARAGNSRFEIRLDPPELGRIDVRLDVDRDGNVTSRLVIERADTYDLLRRDQSTLERALQQAGLKTSENSMQFSLRDEGASQNQRDRDTPAPHITAIVTDGDVPTAEVAANGYGRLLGGRSGIDIRI